MTLSNKTIVELEQILAELRSQIDALSDGEQSPEDRAAENSLFRDVAAVETVLALFSTQRIDQAQ